MQAILRAARVLLIILPVYLVGAHAAARHGVKFSADEIAFAAEVAQAGGPSQAAVLDILSRVKVQSSILEAIARPAEAVKPWKDYRPIFMTDQRIADGVAFLRANRALLTRIGSEYGVPPQIIVAIIGVETGYGRNLGKYRVIDALDTLAFHYPPRAKFFRGELKQVFLLGNRLAVPIEQLMGSYAGAMGWCQFMPTSIANWAKDEDGDGRIDLWNSLPDITASVANYFQAHGWQNGQPTAVRAQAASDARALDAANSEPLYSVRQIQAMGYEPVDRVNGDALATLLTLDGAQGTEYWITFGNFQAITRYNRSPLYAMAVWQLAQAIARDAAS
ncbi:MAG: lytic murein transglycosylase B [Rhodanobacter sp.]|jgi:membrane-bound lytic murein transglycosylase B|nr:lytic murein transglycosylase B [Rhodanobacter sp.]